MISQQVYFLNPLKIYNSKHSKVYSTIEYLFKHYMVWDANGYFGQNNPYQKLIKKYRMDYKKNKCFNLKEYLVSIVLKRSYSYSEVLISYGK